MIEVFFDIETKKLFDQLEDRTKIADLGVSIVSVYRREVDSDNREIKGEMKSFWENELPQMWPWFEDANRIIGFNSVKFDVPVLAPHYHRDLNKLPHFDILGVIKDSLGFRISLDSIAKETLGKQKLASGLDAVDYWNSGDPVSLAKLKEYCEMDVEVTREVYDYGMKHGMLKFKNKWNESHEVVVDFSYPVVEADAGLQMGLF
jgi:DEAD/DEAH box helicase domain-containing protein